MRLAVFEFPFPMCDLTLTGRDDPVHPFGEFHAEHRLGEVPKAWQRQTGATDTAIMPSTASDRIPFIINSNTNH